MVFSSPPQFAVIGDDPRQAALAQSLRQKGFSVFTFSPSDLSETSSLKDVQVVIFPLPLSTISCKEWLRCLSLCPPNALIFGGKIPPQYEHTADKLGFSVMDYMKNESTAILNAVPTAEGAVQLALAETDFTLWESHCLVAGFGRCGKVLALLLKNMGAHVTVAARNNSDLALSKTLGLSGILLRDLSSVLPQQEIIFNTIPACVFNASVLSQVSPSCLMIDLASADGGIDFAAAQKKKINTIHALALPGKTAPVTAGKIICDSILQTLNL